MPWPSCPPRCPPCSRAALRTSRLSWRSTSAGCRLGRREARMSPLLPRARGLTDTGPTQALRVGRELAPSPAAVGRGGWVRDRRFGPGWAASGGTEGPAASPASSGSPGPSLCSLHPWHLGMSRLHFGCRGAVVGGSLGSAGGGRVQRGGCQVVQAPTPSGMGSAMGSLAVLTELCLRDCCPVH